MTTRCPCCGAPVYVQSFREAFGLTPAPAAVLAVLYEAHPLDAVTAAQLMARAGRAHRAQIAGTHVTRIRAALGDTAVECIRGRGWRLRPAARARCEGVLNPHATADSTNGCVDERPRVVDYR